MGHGPRDWNPPGYWDAPTVTPSTRSRTVVQASRSRAKESNLIGLLSVALGLFATLLPLAHPDVSTGVRGFAFTTAGIAAVSLASRAAQLRRQGRATSRVLPAIGGFLGVTGTLLSVWSLLFFYVPNAVPPMPSITSLTSLGQPVAGALVGPIVPGVIQQNTQPAPVAAPVAAAPPAVGPAPETLTPEQMRSAMQMAAGTISYVMKHVRPAGQPWPDALYVNADQLVTTPTGDVLVRIPAGTDLGYARSISGENYRLTISDSSTGAGVAFDTATGYVTNR
jgi:hypothetical protein